MKYFLKREWAGGGGDVGQFASVVAWHRPRRASRLIDLTQSLPGRLGPAGPQPTACLRVGRQGPERAESCRLHGGVKWTGRGTFCSVTVALAGLWCSLSGFWVYILHVTCVAMVGDTPDHMPCLSSTLLSDMKWLVCPLGPGLRMKSGARRAPRGRSVVTSR